MIITKNEKFWNLSQIVMTSPVKWWRHHFFWHNSIHKGLKYERAKFQGYCICSSHFIEGGGGHFVPTPPSPEQPPKPLG